MGREKDKEVVEGRNRRLREFNEFNLGKKKRIYWEGWEVGGQEEGNRQSGEGERGWQQTFLGMDNWVQ